MSGAQLQNTAAPAVSSGAQEPNTQITYSAGLVTVVARNASLDEIIRQVAAKVGMQVNGRVPNDRVFGTYGPESASGILTTLLDGSGINLIIVQSASNQPLELVLTQRSGGATPPNPSSQVVEEGSRFQGGNIPPAPNQFPTPAAAAPSRATNFGRDTNPAATAPSSTAQQLIFPPVDASTPSTTGSTTPMTPGSSAPKTPQQIFEELQRLRNKQSSAPQ